MNNHIHLTVTDDFYDDAVFCPVCGRGIFAGGGCEGCSHALFNHGRNAEDDDFFYIIPKYSRIARKAEREDRDPLEAVIEAIEEKRPAAIIISMHYKNAAGEENNRVTTAIDYAPKAPDAPTRAKRKK